jgi:hypothetical protein
MKVQSGKRPWPLGRPGVYNLSDSEHVIIILQSTREVLFDAHRAIQDNETFDVDDEDALLLETTQQIILQRAHEMLPDYDLREIQTVFPRTWMYTLQLDKLSPHNYRIVKQSLWQAACALGEVLNRLRESKPKPQGYPSS